MSEDQTATPYRPVGGGELRLTAESGYTAFPPRLPERPISYRALDEEYAAQIARDRNTKHGACRRGYVTRFRVRSGFSRRCEAQTAGGSVHRELWVPAEELAGFNANIVGPAGVIAEFAGADGAGGA